MHSTLLVSQEPSIAQQFMEVSLQVTKEGGGAPTVVARNLFHMSAAMYDVWCIYHPENSPFLLGQKKGAYENTFNPSFRIPDSLNNKAELEKAIAYAAYRMLIQKHSEIRGKRRSIDIIDSLFNSLGYSPNERGENYTTGQSSAIGNYVASCYITFGYLDFSNESQQYEDFEFQTHNPSLNLAKSGNSSLEDKNRWQPIYAYDYVKNKGLDSSLFDWNLELIENDDQFLTPQWGKVIPFALDSTQLTFVEKDGEPYPVYFDPGPPPFLNYGADSINSELYQWGFSLVGLWSGYLDASLEELIDISPASRGNIVNSDDNLESYYLALEGKTKNKGHGKNPYTKKPYQSNWVKKADYARVIAEYWVDGINTYSPPGHWMQTLISVKNHPEFSTKWAGKSPVLSDLEWDIKSYFTLSGAMHDAGIAAWGVKVAYDYIRPISAIRYMAKMGQSSDPNLPHFHQEGLKLIPGKIELVSESDPLAKTDKANLNKVKIRAWRGPDAIENQLTDEAGVDWILAENWWPYQRYSFVTPPFSGYVSGHSCFSFAAATALEKLTGDAYFPGGLAEYTAKKNAFLVFENGPSEDITLQWATYRDAATETCISRIWGGIHPPHDDMMGRIMGEKIGKNAFEKSQNLFSH